MPIFAVRFQSGVQAVSDGGEAVTDPCLTTLTERCSRRPSIESKPSELSDLLTRLTAFTDWLRAGRIARPRGVCLAKRAWRLPDKTPRPPLGATNGARIGRGEGMAGNVWSFPGASLHSWSHNRCDWRPSPHPGSRISARTRRDW